MTKYILHGGRTKIGCKSNDQFYKEIFDIQKIEVNFLVVSFARGKLEQKLSFDEIERIKRLNSGKKINFIWAEPSKFEDQLISADAIFLRGGDTKKLASELLKLKNFKELLDGKIIAGSSAGFIILARYYYDQDYNQIQTGLGLLPIKAISHFDLPNSYDKDFKKELAELQNYRSAENLKTVALRETEFKIIEQ